jgi:hypothetical protein
MVVFGLRQSRYGEYFRGEALGAAYRSRRVIRLRGICQGKMGRKTAGGRVDLKARRKGGEPRGGGLVSGPPRAAGGIDPPGVLTETVLSRTSLGGVPAAPWCTYRNCSFKNCTWRSVVVFALSCPWGRTVSPVVYLQKLYLQEKNFDCGRAVETPVLNNKKGLPGCRTVAAGQAGSPNGLEGV